jgi:hypothetical protein
MRKPIVITGAHPGQQALITAVLSSDARHFAIVCPRQWGKTTASSMLALHWAMQPKPARIWWVTPIREQGKSILENVILKRLRDAGAIRSINMSDLVVSFVNGSSLEFKSADSRDRLRGPSVDYLVMDEYAFFPPGLYDSILSAMTIHRGKKTLFVSTPNGRNDFHARYIRGLGDDPDYVSLRYTIESTGMPNVINEVESRRAFTPDLVYRQEYLAEFVEDSGSVFANVARPLAGFAEPTATNYAGVDVGKTHDRTAICVLNNRGELVAFKRFELAEQRLTETMVARIADFLRPIRNCQTLIEINYESTVVEMLRGKLSNVRSMRTTAENKNDLIDNLVYRLQSGGVTLPNNRETDVLYEELVNFAVQRAGNGWRFGAPSGGYDDCVIALAYALRSLMNGSGGVGIYVIK